ncbi:MAG: small multi-drug export protein [Candidatus Omnitrophica bacterium]|nr:small multi-drug export protein [Candidatus Omnitrophota bacterium]
MLETILKVLSALPKELTTFILAMMPVSELRGAIPFGLSTGLALRNVLFLSIVGNLIPVIPILFLLQPVSGYLRRFWIFKKFFDWLFERTRRRAELVEKYETLGLMLFVAIPLPITGAWTGCVAASLFKVRLRYALLAITLGVLIAAFIVTSVYFIGKGIFYNVFIPHS